MTIEPAVARESNGVRSGVPVGGPSIIVVSAAVLSIVVTVFGVAYAFVVSKTQIESNQATMDTRLTAIQNRLDNQIVMMGDMSTRLTRLEESTKFIEQSIAELKLEFASSQKR